MCMWQSWKVEWDMINTLFLTLWLSNLLLLLFFSTRKRMSIAAHANLSKFFEKQWSPNHPQYLSGLSRALFRTTFLKIAVLIHSYICYILLIYLRLYIYTSFLYYRHMILSSICCLVVDVVGDFSWGYKIQCIEYTIDWKKSKVCRRERYNRAILYRLEVTNNYKLMNLFNPTYYL